MATAPQLSVVIPAFNEEARVLQSLELIAPYLQASGLAYEVIVVDDGSSDSTAALVREAAAANSHVRALELKPNQGKGRAVAEGVLASRGELVLVSDTDFSSPIEEMSKLQAAIDAGADIAIGSRAKRGAREKEQPIHRVLMGKTFNLMVQAVALPGLWDTQCGFKLYKGKVAREVFSKLRTDGFAFDVEALLRARRAGYRVAEVPVVWRHSAPTRILPFRHSAQMVRDLVRIRFMP